MHHIQKQNKRKQCITLCFIIIVQSCERTTKLTHCTFKRLEKGWTATAVTPYEKLNGNVLCLLKLSIVPVLVKLEMNELKTEGRPLWMQATSYRHPLRLDFKPEQALSRPSCSNDESFVEGVCVCVCIHVRESACVSSVRKRTVKSYLTERMIKG